MKKSDKKKVYEAYNQIIEWFDENRSKDLAMEKHYLAFIQKHIPAGGTILDVGCGTGEPMADFFIKQKYKVTGVDASTKMIDLCKQRFPTGRWILADMRELALPEQFDLVIAWHSLFHLPPEDQEPTLNLLASFVKQGGLFIFTGGPEYGEIWSENGGYDLYHASLATEDYQKILAKNNFKILIHKIRDPDCGEATVWVAKKCSKITITRYIQC